MFGDRIANPSARTAMSVVAVIALAGVGTIAGQWIRRPSSTTLAPVERASGPERSPKFGKSGAPTEVVVHIVGAVRQPGMHTFPADTRLKTALTAAGVFSNADLTPFNLAAKLQDGTQISVPKRAVAKGSPRATLASSGTRTAQRSARPTRLSGRVAGLAPLPVPVPDAYAGVTARAYRRDDDPTGDVMPSEALSRREPRSSASSGRKVAPSQPVDINRAGIDELQRLPGVGPSLANAIIAYREAKGGFASIDELDSVKGIGPKKLASLRPHVRL
ncbi:MAG: helix-hairpin-helix domain-containing protein [Fimbriimonadaceae bacterium]|nr:helix-hairpin-helix domain-containing protein [Fimbriimonadaceae bacterium]